MNFKRPLVLVAQMHISACICTAQGSSESHFYSHYITLLFPLYGLNISQSLDVIRALVFRVVVTRGMGSPTCRWGYELVNMWPFEFWTEDKRSKSTQFSFSPACLPTVALCNGPYLRALIML